METLSEARLVIFHNSSLRDISKKNPYAESQPCEESFLLLLFSLKSSIIKLTRKEGVPYLCYFKKISLFHASKFCSNEEKNKCTPICIQDCQ